MKQLPKLYTIGLRFPKTVLLVSLLLAIFSAFHARKLSIKSDLTALLPHDTQSVKNLDEMNRYFGGSSYLFTTVEAKDAITAKRFADALATELENHPSVLYVESKKPVDYFKPRQWLYLDIADLRDMEARIDRGLELETQGVNVFLSDWMNFTDEGTLPDLSFKDIIEKYKKRGNVDLDDRIASTDGTFVVLKVKVKDDAEKMDASRKLLSDFRNIATHVKASLHAQDIVVGFTGGHATKIEQVDALTSKMSTISLSVSAILMLILLLYFRRPSAMIFIGTALFISIIWTGGLVYLVFGHLNVITGFAASILSGLGSDYGIYLMSRYDQERRAGCDFFVACERAFAKTGRATHASMITTIAAFAALFFSSFGVFCEFGVVGVLGIASTYIAMMLIIPSLLILWERFRGTLDSHAVSIHSTGIQHWENQLTPYLARFFSKSVAKCSLVVILVLTGVAALSLPQKMRISFESGQMDNKQLPSNKLYTRVSEVIGNTLSPTVLIVHGYDEAKRICKAFTNAIETDTHSPFKMVFGLPMLIPDHQAEKQQIIKRLRDKFSKLHVPKGDKRTEFLDGLETSMNASVISQDTLPPLAVRPFISSHSPDLFAVYLFPSVNRGTAAGLEKYRSTLAAVRDANQLKFSEVDGNFITADTVALIKNEAPKSLSLLLVFLAIVLVIVIPSRIRATVILFQLLAGLILLSGAMHLSATSLNILNICTISIILGTGIDSFIHFSHRYDETHDIVATVKSKTVSILTSNLTTIVGFGGLLFTENAGIVSIGALAVLGLLIVTVLSVTVFPQCLALMSGFSKNRA